MIKKILIANRSEIAVRIIQTAREMDIKTVTIYSSDDRNSYYNRISDESVFIGDGSLKDTYLNIDKIIEAAKNSGADAIHPGYGFLAENADFAQACVDNNLIFIGPSPQAIRTMGNKLNARKLAGRLNVPVLKGITGDVNTILKGADNLEFPLIIKAVAGGGGKGMRIINSKNELPGALEAAGREAKSYFGDGTVYVEKYIAKPKHIEFQILGDKFGKLIHLNERECTIQRRYQKIIEESPSPSVSEDLRVKMGNDALKLAREINYYNAGTVEFLLDEKGRYYFLEMNTRIQVEHPVTEFVTGIDLVKHQILIASGERLDLDTIDPRGHAIECRIYAENPLTNFSPSPGFINFIKLPYGAGVRNDTGIIEPSVIQPHYDPMISKLITYGESREDAVDKMIYSLKNYIVHGIDTNIEYLLAILENNKFRNNQFYTDFCKTEEANLKEHLNKKRNALEVEIPTAIYAAKKLSAKDEIKNGEAIDNEFNVWKIIGSL
ncbi:acetyl-CoA carboxylase biotin carboxylase subunit [Melioribacter sp. Ez-97]|uniref:acetyl-CoA carboxylase biotin carboxylase subunit n=1 Tax=Melioribacter sp. Ez-97 TaxID=3423434 RepID=UPI003EDAB348